MMLLIAAYAYCQMTLILPLFITPLPMPHCRFSHHYAALLPLRH